MPEGTLQPAPQPTPHPNGRLLEVVLLALRLGFTAFGGPAAHIAMLRQEVVQKRGWITDEEFLDLLGATNLIPGPNSSEMVMHVGYKRAGQTGLVLAGLAFVGPAVGITLLCALVYQHFGTLPQTTGALRGVQAVVLAVVAHAAWGLLVPMRRHGLKLGVVVFSATLALLGVHELIVMLLAVAALAIALGLARSRRLYQWDWALFGGFLKIGSVLYGSGYVLVGFLRNEFVTRQGLITETTLLDAIAVGQITPGPVFASATFLGYSIAGLGGAMAATVGIFLPAFFFCAISAKHVQHLRNHPWGAALLDATSSAALGLLLTLCFQLAHSIALEPWRLLLFALALVALVRGRVSSVWLLLLGAGLGLVLPR